MFGRRTNAAARIERILVFHQGPVPTTEEIRQILDMFKDRFDADTEGVRVSAYDVTRFAAADIEGFAQAKVAALSGSGDLTAGALYRTVTYPVAGQGVVTVVWRDAIPALKQRKA